MVVVVVVVVAEEFGRRSHEWPADMAKTEANFISEENGNPFGVCSV